MQNSTTAIFSENNTQKAIEIKLAKRFLKLWATVSSLYYKICDTDGKG